MLWKKMKERIQTKTMSISSTSMADYDRDEAEDLVSKITSCHTALAKHYEDINGIIPHMTKTQMATYLGKNTYHASS